MDIRKLFLGIFGFLVIILLYMIFFSSSGKSKNDKKRQKGKAVAGLFLGGPLSDDNMERKLKGFRDPNASLEGSSFWKDGVDTSEPNSVTTNAEEGENPINPQTGKPYDNETMEQFAQLTLLFPENDLIPKKQTVSYKEAQAKKQAEISKATAAYIGGNPTKEDVRLHFGSQEKVFKDRMEIIEYLVEIQKEEGELDKDGQLKKILDGAKEQQKQFEQQKAEAYAKYGI
ncbi:MAG: hypothetical protein SFU98_12275 [Leptospiraceae bacterium]|nr:hypothetical protein [Leptospiraceae bacterium]